MPTHPPNSRAFTTHLTRRTIRRFQVTASRLQSYSTVHAVPYYSSYISSQRTADRQPWLRAATPATIAVLYIPPPLLQVFPPACTCATAQSQVSSQSIGPRSLPVMPTQTPIQLSLLTPIGEYLAETPISMWTCSMEKPIVCLV